MSERINVTLSEPLDYQGRVYTELVFRKLKVKDLIAADMVEGETRKTLAMIASNADIPLGAAEELLVVDFSRINTEIAPLLGN